MCILQHQKSDKNNYINSCFEEYVMNPDKNRFNLRNFKKNQSPQTQIFKYP